MTNDQAPAAPAAKENLLGICNAVGEDLGFNPLFLRIPLAALLLWNPVAILSAYAALGMAVLATRLLFPKKNQVAMDAASAAVEAVDEPMAFARAA